MIYRHSYLRNQNLTESIFLHGPDNKLLRLLKATRQKLPTIQKINWKMASPCPKKRLLTKCSVIRIALAILKPCLSEKNLIPGDRSGRWSEGAHPTLEEGEERFLYRSGLLTALGGLPSPQHPWILLVTPPEPRCTQVAWPSNRDIPCQESPISEHSQKF